MLYLYFSIITLLGPFDGPQGSHAEGTTRQTTIFICLTFIPKSPCAQILATRSSRLTPLSSPPISHNLGGRKPCISVKRPLPPDQHSDSNSTPKTGLEKVGLVNSLLGW